MPKKLDLTKYTQVGDILYKHEYFNANQKLQPNGCIHWTAGKHVQGYGMCGIIDAVTKKPKMAVVHRIAMRIKLGRAITSKENVIHQVGCSPLCCNPDHLFLGTLSDRNRIMYANGRGPNNFTSGRGSRSNQKQKRKYNYTDEEMLWMRKHNTQEIAQRFNMSTIKASRLRYAVRNGFLWLKDPEAK